jgi:2,4-dienoyl-CoA reductase-like NADH-dependent reductase (Old Yellow Enzyme family)
MTAQADPFAPGRLGPLTLRNRVVKAATFEGLTREGLVTDALVDFHRRFAAGGVAMTTVAHLAVSPEGRTHRAQIHLREAMLPGLRRLSEAVHAEGAAASAQLGHAGPVANPVATRLPSIAPSRRLNPMGPRITRAVTEPDIVRITADFARGARLVADAGFDCVELHLGHSYLLSSFLSPSLNRRTDRWGGPLKNRARFPREVVQAVRTAVGGSVAVVAKLNMSDGVRGGLQPDESVEVARMLEADGGLDALVLTGGSSLANPMYLFRGDAPVRSFAATLPPMLRLGVRLAGHRFLRSYPFEEAYFLPSARRFREALAMPLVLLGGITRLETMERALAEGFGFVAMARALLHDPDLVRRMAEGSTDRSLCTHCNECMPTISSGTRCVLTGEPATNLGCVD